LRKKGRNGWYSSATQETPHVPDRKREVLIWTGPYELYVQQEREGQTREGLLIHLERKVFHSVHNWMSTRLNKYQEGRERSTLSSERDPFPDAGGGMTHFLRTRECSCRIAVCSGGRGETVEKTILGSEKTGADEPRQRSKRRKFHDFRSYWGMK